MKFFVYQLIHVPTNVCWYVGSTDDMEVRWREHKRSLKRRPALIHRIINQDKLENIVMEQVDTIDAEDKFSWEVLYLEQCWINILSPKYNEVRAYTPKWMKIEQMKNYHKLRYENRKEEIDIRNKKWFDEHKEEVKKYHKKSGEKYREKNREEAKQKTKKWYAENKENVRKKITCGCGRTIAYSSKSQHIKTRKHQDWLKNSTNISNG